MSDQTVSVSDWQRIAAKQIARCEAGDQRACEWVAKHRPIEATGGMPSITYATDYGKPGRVVEIERQISTMNSAQIKALLAHELARIEAAAAPNLDTLSDEQLDRYIARLQAADRAAWDATKLTDEQIASVLAEHDRRTQAKRATARAHVAETYDLSEPAPEIDPAG